MLQYSSVGLCADSAAWSSPAAHVGDLGVLDEDVAAPHQFADQRLAGGQRDVAVKSWQAIVPDNDNRAMFLPLTMAALAGAAALIPWAALDRPRRVPVEPFFARLRLE